MSGAAYWIETVDKHKHSTLVASHEEEPALAKRITHTDRCYGCENALWPEMTPAAIVENYGGVNVLCERCVTHCQGDDCEAVCVTASYVIADTYDEGGCIPQHPACSMGCDHFICIGCYEDAYARCDYCEGYEPYEDVGLFKVPESRYVRGNGWGAPEEHTPHLPEFDVDDEDDAPIMRAVDDGSVPVAVLSVCSGCTDGLAFDVRRAWNEARSCS